MMMLMLTAVAAWVTVGSGGGDRNDGAISGLVMPGMHPIGAQNETEYKARPGIVHTMTFVGHVGERPLVVGFDTFSELDVVRKSVVDSKWRVLDHEGIGVHGVGDARFGKLMEMPIRYRYMSAETVLQVRVADDKHMPTGVDVVCGTSTQEEEGSKFDTVNKRLELWEQGLAIVMEPAWKLRCRINSKPLRVLEICAGVSGSYAVFRDMGYKVAEWHAVESDAKTREIVEYMYGDKVRHIGDDVVSFSVTQKYDVVMAGPPCQPWSRANPDALGFDDDRADVFIHCAGIIQEVMRRNPAAKYMMENVVMSNELRDRGRRTSRICRSSGNSRCCDKVHSICGSRRTDNRGDNRTNYVLLGTLFWDPEADDYGSTFRFR